MKIYEFESLFTEILINKIDSTLVILALKTFDLMFTKGLPTDNFEKSGGLDELEKLQLFWSEEIV